MNLSMRELVACACWLSLAVACGDDAGATPEEGGDPTDGSSASESTSASATGSESSGDPTSASATTTDTSASSSGDATVDTTADDSGTTGGPDPIELGEVCPLTERIGEIAIWYAAGQASLYGIVWDKPDPWIGPAEIETSTCAFHRFATESCGGCAPPQVCSFAGECVDPRVAFTEAELDVTANGATETIVADGITGQLYGEVGDGDAEISMTLRVPGQADLEIPALPFATPLPDLTLTADGDSCTPLGLDATWTPRDDGSRIRTVIPINHHAGGPTFTICDVPTDGDSFHADAEMLQPLAVITCLEFQGVDVAQTAAAHTPLGCIDIRLGVQPPSDLVWQ